MAGASSGGEANYWPGFVDALTNVVIAMVFVIVVLAMALSFSAQLLAKRMAEKVARLQATNAELTAKVAFSEHAMGAASTALRTSLPSPKPSPSAAAPDRVASNLQQPDTLIVVQGNEAAASVPGGALRQAAASLMLEYAGSALRPDDEAQRRLVERLAQAKAQLDGAPPGAKLLLLARGPDMAFSENQRIAFIRVMLVRNTMIEQGISPERITTRIDVTASPARGSVSVVLENAK